MKSYFLTLLAVLFICQSAFGSTYASKLDRVSDADMKEAVLRGGLTVADLGGGGLISSGTPYYVDSVNGADNRSGKSWALAVATIDQAIDLAQAARVALTDDGRPIIYVREIHRETLTGSSSLVPDLPGVIIRGVGYGDNRPLLTGSPVNADQKAIIVVTGSSTIFSNLRFTMGSLSIDDSLIDVFIQASASYVTIDNCEFFDTGDISVGNYITTSASTVSNLTVSNCIQQGTYSIGGGLGGGDGFIMVAGGGGHRIFNNTSAGSFVFANIQPSSIYASTGGTVDMLIANNWFTNDASQAAFGIRGLGNSSSGWIADNRVTIQATMSGNAGTGAEVHIGTIGSMVMSENYGSWIRGYAATIVGTLVFDGV